MEQEKNPMEGWEISDRSQESSSQESSPKEVQGGILVRRAPRKRAWKRSGVLIAILVFLAWLGVMQSVAAEKYEVAVRISAPDAPVQDDVAPGLDFGQVEGGDAARRFVTISNQGKTDAYVQVLKWGKASRFLEVNRSGFTLHQGESQNLEFTLQAPSGAQQKEYRGKVWIFELPKFF